MQKKLLTTAVLLGLGGFGTSANADLASGSLGLSIEGNLNPACLYGGTYPACAYGAFDTADAGSYFNMDGSPAAAVDGNNTMLVNGTAQPYSGPAFGPGSAYPGGGDNITQDWDFFGNIGTNFSVDAGLTVGANDASVAMSGWRVGWGEVPEINMGLGADAVLSCTGGIDANACELGESFTLTYAAVVPEGDPSGFGGVLYELNLQGSVVQTIPVPAAVWLFGSGLLGLVGVARRRKAS